MTCNNELDNLTPEQLAAIKLNFPMHPSAPEGTSEYCAWLRGAYNSWLFATLSLDLT